MRDIDMQKAEYENYIFGQLGLIPRYKTTNILGNYKTNMPELIKNMSTNPKKAREVSLTLYGANGVYTQIINYISNLYTFDYYVYPNFKMGRDESPEAIKDYFYRVAVDLDKLNVKATFSEILKGVVKEGTVFAYEVNSPNKSNLRILPYEYCKVTYSEGGVCRYAVNISMISEQTVKIFPPEIRQAWRNHQSDRALNYWYQVSNKGVAFTTNEYASHGLPFFSFMIDGLDRYEGFKERSDIKDELDIFKMIHNKIPLDPKTNRPSIDSGQARTFHDATKANTPDTVSVATNPFEISSISFDRTTADKNDIMERATQELWNNSGLSFQLFNNTNNSAEALRKNVIVNMIALKSFFNSFNIYMNTRLLKYKHSFVFLPITEMNKREVTESYTSLLGYGGSRMLVMAAEGLEPLQIINLLNFEQNVLDIDSIMVPKQTSHTMSDKQSGRPRNEDKGVIDSESAEDSKNRGDF